MDSGLGRHGENFQALNFDGDDEGYVNWEFLIQVT